MATLTLETVTDILAAMLFIERESNNLKTMEKIENRIEISDSLRNLIKFSEKKDYWSIKGVNVMRSTLTEKEDYVYYIMANIFSDGMTSDNNMPYNDLACKLIYRLKEIDSKYFARIKAISETKDFNCENLGIKKIYNIFEKIEIAKENIKDLQSSLNRPDVKSFEMTESDAKSKANDAVEYLEEALKLAKQERENLSKRKDVIKTRRLIYDPLHQLQIDFPESKFNVGRTGSEYYLYIVSSPEDLSKLVKDKDKPMEKEDYTPSIKLYVDLIKAYNASTVDVFIKGMGGKEYTCTKKS